MSVAEHSPLYQPCPGCKRLRELADQCDDECEWLAVEALSGLAAGCSRCRGVGFELTEQGLQLLTLFKPHLRVLLASLTKEGGEQ